jgi:multidrug efflux pump subunit AcrB
MFIKKGLHQPLASRSWKTVTILDNMQAAYNKTIEWCLNIPALQWLQAFPIIIAGLLFKTGIKQKFFPMPSVTSLHRALDADRHPAGKNRGGNPQNRKPPEE